MQLKQIMRLSLLTCALFIQTPYVSGQTKNSQYSLGTEYEKFLDWNKKTGISGQYFDEVTDETIRRLNITVDEYWHRVLVERKVYLLGEINDATAPYISSLLLYLDRKSDKIITLHIDSNGGNAYSGLGIYDAIQFLNSPIYTECDSLAASMAAVIFSCGQHGHRSVTKNARIMIHAPYAPNPKEKAIHDIQLLEKEIQLLEKEIYKILSENTGKDIQTITQDCEKTLWLTGEDAIRYGIADVLHE